MLHQALSVVNASWSWIGTNSEPLTVVLAAAAVLVAWRQVGKATTQLRQTASQSEKESFDRNRPYVWMALSAGLSIDRFIDLRLQNTGGSIAENVWVELIEGEYVSSSGKDAIDLGKKLPVALRAKADMAPGESRRFVWRSLNNSDNAKTPEGGPWVGLLRAHYSWHDGRAEKIEFTTDYRFDLDTPSGVMPGANAGLLRSGKITTENALENVALSLRRITKELNEMRR